MLEVEKKYKLHQKSFNDLKKFFDTNLNYWGMDSETNTLYSGNSLTREHVLRIREIEDEFQNYYTVTYKNRVTGKFKSNLELEFDTNTPHIYNFFEALGYEKG